MKLSCVILAAGQSVRFGSNKLLADFRGSTLIDMALSVIPSKEFFQVVVVTHYSCIIKLAKKFGFYPIYNDSPELGISHSIKLGLNKLIDTDAVMFMVSDQPLLKQSSISDLITYYHNNPDKIVALGHNGRKGNPVIFPRIYYDELMQLSGDCGGSHVIKKHPSSFSIYNIDDPMELMDMDTVLDFERFIPFSGDTKK